MNKPLVGFIGPGIMGQPMALNLIKAGYSLAVYARRPEAAQPLADAGAKLCGSPAEVGKQCAIIFTIVSDTPDVEEVITGDSGIIQGAEPGDIVVDMSTISPTRTIELANKLADKGIEMLDAPVSGGDKGAIAGTLSIMVGGKLASFERVRPLFECMGKNIVHIGDHGAGQITKACNQIVVAGTIAAVSEALLLAKTAGVDAASVREALLGGFAGSKILEIHGQRILRDEYTPGFKVKLHQKDMRIVNETAEALGLKLQGALQAQAYLDELIELGDGELDSAAIAKVIAAHAVAHDTD